MKTRAEGSESPLTTVSGAQVVQTNLQMVCTGGQITFLQSYLPEKDTSNFFYIRRNDLLLNVVQEICDHILLNTVFTGWHNDDHPQLSKLGEQLFGHTANFEKDTSPEILDKHSGKGSEESYICIIMHQSDTSNFTPT